MRSKTESTLIFNFDTANIDNAKKAERIVYENMSRFHGIKNVRGAGHTNSINF